MVWVSEGFLGDKKSLKKSLKKLTVFYILRPFENLFIDQMIK